MHCVSGSETWGGAGSSSRAGIAVAHPGNRPDSRRQRGSSHPSPTTLRPRRSDITPTSSLHTDHSQVRPGLPAYVARSCVIGTLPANDRVAMVTDSGGVGVRMADDANRGGLAAPPMPESP